jgi:hypothetical protein
VSDKHTNAPNAASETAKGRLVDSLLLGENLSDDPSSLLSLPPLREEGITTLTALMLATNQEMMDLLEALGPVRIVDHEAGTVEIEMPNPKIGLSPVLKQLLRVAARNHLAPAPSSRNSQPRPQRRARADKSVDDARG